MEQNSQFSMNSVYFMKNHDVICFLTWKRRNTWNLSTLSIFRYNWSPKIYRLGQWGPKANLLLQCDVYFWRKYIFSKSNCYTVSVSLLKQYTSLIYVKEKSFSLLNSAFSFAGPQGSISYSKAAKIFHAYEG